LSAGWTSQRPTQKSGGAADRASFLRSTGRF
jgi:hypothetical protein